MNTAASTRNSTKRSTNVYLTASLVDKARSMDMNLSATLDTLLAQAIEAKNVEREEEKRYASHEPIYGKGWNANR